MDFRFLGELFVLLGVQGIHMCLARLASEGQALYQLQQGSSLFNALVARVSCRFARVAGGLIALS